MVIFHSYVSLPEGTQSEKILPWDPHPPSAYGQLHPGRYARCEGRPRRPRPRGLIDESPQGVLVFKSLANIKYTMRKKSCRIG